MKTLNKDLAAVQLSQVQLQEVIEQLKQDDSILMQAYCEYSAENGYNSVYDNDEHTINDLFSNPYDALRAASYGEYNPLHAYFTFNGYGNLQSFEYLDSDSSPINIGELAQWLIDEDILSDYGITVTTLDDMLASIEDNISDNESLSLSLIGYLNLPVESLKEIESYGYDNYNEYLKEQLMDFISDYDYNHLNDIINYLGINYE